MDEFYNQEKAMKVYEEVLNNFFEKLDKDNGFDCDLIDYLNHIKYLSEIKLGDLSDDKKRDKIEEIIGNIQEFISKYSESYYEIGKIKVFKIIKAFKKIKEIDYREYFYYIADQKMKATLYYVRYLNFLENHLLKENSESYIERKMEEIIPQLEEMEKICTDALNHFKNKEKKESAQKIEELCKIISDLKEEIKESLNISTLSEKIKRYIDHILYFGREHNGIIGGNLYNEIQNKSLNIVNAVIDLKVKFKCNNINYLKYMMFNNFMKEIRYVGVAYQYLWHWDDKESNLFRYFHPVYDAVSEREGLSKGSRMSCRDFFGHIFNSAISQMNGDNDLCSYTKDPFIMIYKYLKFPKCKGTEKKEEYRKIEDFQIKIEEEIASDEIFSGVEMIKSARINVINRENKWLNFYEFIEKESQSATSKNLPYCVEMMPNLENEEKNEKGTSKNIKFLIRNYFKSWGYVEPLKWYIADDKEVVTMGRNYDSEYDIYEKGIPKHYDDCSDMSEENINDAMCKYTMKLGKQEIIYLLLKIGEKIRKITLDSVIKNVVENFVYHIINKELEKIEKCIKSDGSENITIKMNIFSIQMEITVFSEYLEKRVAELKSSKNEVNKSMVEKVIVSEIKEQIKKEAKNYIKERYDNIIKCGDEEGVYHCAKFILKFIDSEKYFCPYYINTYEQYEPERCDDEISRLKEVIFKGGM